MTNKHKREAHELVMTNGHYLQYVPIAYVTHAIRGLCLYVPRKVALREAKRFIRLYR